MAQLCDTRHSAEVDELSASNDHFMSALGAHRSIAVGMSKSLTPAGINLSI